MQITLKTYSNLRSVIGKPELVIEIDEDSVFEDLIGVLTERYGEKFEKKQEITSGKVSFVVSMCI